MSERDKLFIGFHPKELPTWKFCARPLQPIIFTLVTTHRKKAIMALAFLSKNYEPISKLPKQNQL